MLPLLDVARTICFAPTEEMQFQMQVVEGGM